MVPESGISVGTDEVRGFTNVIHGRNGCLGEFSDIFEGKFLGYE